MQTSQDNKNFSSEPAPIRSNLIEENEKTQKLNRAFTIGGNPTAEDYAEADRRFFGTSDIHSIIKSVQNRLQEVPRNNKPSTPSASPHS